MALPIEDYAVLGDHRTAALVGRDGSVDWLCLPRFDSPACFAALVGNRENGRWLLGPAGPAQSRRRYVDHSTVLETVHTTDTGSVRVVDVMPVNDGRADLVRTVTGLSGTVRMRHEWIVRFGYGKIRPWVHRTEAGGVEVITAVAGPDRVMLRGTRLPHAGEGHLEDGHHVDEFDVSEGEQLLFSTTYLASHRPLPRPLDVDRRVETTYEDAEEWAHRCSYDGPHREAVLRSLITLRTLTHSATGGIVAAPTTSLPEEFGGVRNWDYRYVWLRDAALTLQAFLACGYSDEARLWRDWLLRAVAGDPADLQIMYTVDGARELPERELDHLSGYADSRPVRVGNGAVGQRQSDVLGAVMDAFERARVLGLEEEDDSWALQVALVDELATHWDRPDHGLWEIRGPEQHFTHSRVMVWVALDRAVTAVERHGLPGGDGRVERWRTVRDQVRDEVLTKGFDEERNTFTQHYDTDAVDAALLMLPQVGFIPGDDPRMLGTIEAVERELMRDGLVLRYRTETGVDGLPGDEHPFLACSFWLVSAYALAGQQRKAAELMERLLQLPNDVGLLPEEYDPVAERFVGNFPQAFSHLTLVGAAIDLERGAQREREGSGLSAEQ